MRIKNYLKHIEMLHDYRALQWRDTKRVNPQIRISKIGKVTVNNQGHSKRVQCAREERNRPQRPQTSKHNVSQQYAQNN